MWHARPWIIGLLLGSLFPHPATAQADRHAAAAVERAITAAESSLREGELQTTESHYRSALLEGWLLLGALERLEGRLPAAREAFGNASTSAVENRQALQALALVHLQMGQAAQAVGLLMPLAGRNRKDTQTRRLLAQALVADGQLAQAVKELEEARVAAPADLELAFALAGEYLRAKQPERAERLFAEIVKERPMARTHVLVGRTYSDFGEHDRARVELQTALRLDPRAPRAHYYLGMVALKEGGRAELEPAIAEFQAELQVAPRDPLASLELGVALVESQRPGEALPALEVAARSDPPSSRTLYYLGRAQIGVDLPAEAAFSLGRALALAQQQGANAHALQAIHLQLGEALRKLGRTEEAAAQFAEAQRLSIEGTEAEREQLARYMADEADSETAPAPVVHVIEASPLAALPPAERLELKRRATTALARAYLNLGILHAQAERFARAAELIEKAAAVDPDFPKVQSSLGIAYFNSRQFEKATEPLTRARAADPGDAGLKRMLAMAWLNTQAYEKAADLLRDDPERGANPSLQFAFALALVKSDRASEAEPIFADLLARHGDSAELSVLLGQAHAQQGNFDAAVESLQRALGLDATAAEVNATLGEIYLRQGRLAEAEKALRAELLAHPDHLPSQQNLAIVLEREQRPEEAMPVLQSVLKSKPDSADARYLLGKILLAQGAAGEAVEHLQAAARLAPEDANIRYQLGQAYQKLGRTELAQEEFEAFRRIKAKR